MRGDDVLQRLRAAGAIEAELKLARLINEESAASEAYAGLAQRAMAARDRVKLTRAKLEATEKLPVGHPSLVPTAQRSFEPDPERRALLSAADREHALRPFRLDHEEAERDLAAIERGMAEAKSRVVFISGRLIEWARRVPAHIPLAPYTGKITVPRGDARAELASIRARIVELDAEIQRVVTAPFPLAVVRQKIRAFVEAMASKGAPDLLRTSELNMMPALPMISVQLPGNPAQLVIPDTAALLFWFAKDAMLERLLAEAEDVADGDGALTAEERTSIAAKLTGEKLMAERVEEALVEATALPRRLDADPRAVLGLADDVVSPETREV